MAHEFDSEEACEAGRKGGKSSHGRDEYFDSGIGNHS
ncbi:KGG domain-containing protein [Nitrosomonas communis]